MNEFFTWAFLATFAGAVTGTALITQWLKGWLDKKIHLPTQLLAYIIALVIMLAATAATGGLAQPWDVWAMTLLNAVLVSLSANGAYEGIVRMTGAK